MIVAAIEVCIDPLNSASLLSDPIISPVHVSFFQKTRTYQDLGMGVKHWLLLLCRQSDFRCYRGFHRYPLLRIPAFGSHFSSCPYGFLPEDSSLSGLRLLFGHVFCVKYRFLISPVLGTSSCFSCGTLGNVCVTFIVLQFS